jgi:hypothetical protein
MIQSRVQVKERIQAVINSKDRLDSKDDSTDFTWSFNRNTIRITEILIKSIEIPFSYYVFNTNNNFFLINGSTVSITPGTYTFSSLITELETQIDAEIGGTTTITFSTTTYKYTITHSAPIQITANETTSPAARMLGFRATSASATTITGDSAIDLSGPNYLLVRSNFLTKNIAHRMLYADDSYDNVLLDVPTIQATPGSTIGYIPNIPVRLSYPLKIFTTDIIDISLTDEYGNIIDLNGLDWAIQIVFLTE